MSIWVDPNLLSIVGLGLSDDKDVPDGRHLRWFSGRYVGFPRSGFRLSRHNSMINAGWDAAPPDPLIRQQPTSQAEVGFGLKKRFTNGLTVSKPVGFTYTTVASGSSPLLRIDSQKVSLDFGQAGTGPTFPPGPNLSNPAAFVRLVVTRRKNTGHVTASAYYDAHLELRFQDSGSVGPPLVGWFRPELSGSVFESGSGWRLRSSAERLLSEKALEEKDRQAADEQARTSRKPIGTFPLPPFDPNPWTTQSILLNGSFLEHVEITGSDAVLSKVQWITVREYAAAIGWAAVDTFFLPLTDDASIYPAWSPSPGEEVAYKRLTLAPPHRNLPWDDQSQQVDTNLKTRYLAGTFDDIDDAMRLFLKGELAGPIPQAEVEIVQDLEEDPPTEDQEVVKTTVRPLDHLYAAASDPYIARMLGLMTTDFFDPGGMYDYMVQCNAFQDWVIWPLTANLPSQALAKELPRPPVDRASSREDMLIAMSTAVVAKPAPAPDPPPDLQARVDPDLNAQPMPAQVELSWRTDPRNVFENGSASRVFYELLRQGTGAVELMHHKDPDTGQLMPHLPLERVPKDGRLRLVDRSIPEWGSYTWSVRGMDIWGRFSLESVIKQEVQDTIPPPAPTSLDLRLSGGYTAAPAWEGITISFDWTGQQQLISPDLDRFEIDLAQKVVDRAVEANPATWGRFEHTPGATSPPVVVRWPNLSVLGLPAGMTGSVVATPIPDEEGGGQVIAVTLGPVSVPFASKVALVSGTVRAIDVHENRGPFAAHAAARRFDESPPPVPVMPGDVRIAARPDALGRAALKIEWPDLGARQVKVMKSSGSALLAAAGADMTAYEAMDRTARAQTLRTAALAHQEVFTSDHETPYGPGPGAHVSYLSASESGLTVYTIQATSSSGVRAPWPASGSAFVVAATPVTLLPATPMVTEARPGDRQVTVRIAPDLSGEVATLRLYRGRNANEVFDVRAMRLVADVPAPPAGQEIQLEDHDVYPDVDYWYRAVAIGATGSSPPSAAVLARPFTTQPPDPPVLIAARRVTGRVAVRATIARRDLPLFLLRRAAGSVGWTPAEGTGIGADGRLDVAALDPVPASEGYELSVGDQAPQGTVFRYLMRVKDSEGRIADSGQLEETT